VAAGRAVSVRVLALNAGSSTLKYSSYVFDAEGEREVQATTVRATDAVRALGPALENARRALGGEPDVVGHRVVHGGSHFHEPTELSEPVLDDLSTLVPLAPLHLPPALALIRAALAALPRAGHVASFDTSFHHTLPELAQRFALPVELHRRGVRRYGFHGLSYEYIVQSFGGAPPRRLVVAHLGSGASMAAILEGRSIDTTMGLTPTGGIPMGSRSGDLDPGVIIHLQRTCGYSVDRLEHLLDHESGLVGLAGTADVSELSQRAGRGDPDARFALEHLAYSVKKQLGAYAAALGGLDCVVFTGGIGEHSPLIREAALRDLEVLGVVLDPGANASNAPVISAPASACEVRVTATNEDLMIARHAVSAVRTART
jgi:acetate kinase